MTLAKATTQATSAPSVPSASVPATQPDPALEEEFKALFASLASAQAIDSPFDQLDRVADFYAAYIIKKLRVRGDSRVIDPQSLKCLLLNVLTGDESGKFSELLNRFERAHASDCLTGNRLLLVVFQGHVKSGNMPNVWTGFRVKIVEAQGASRSYTPDDVKVIRLHPTRSYDVDQTTFGESTRRAFGLAAAGSGSASGLGAAGNANAQGNEEESECQKFLSRITKVASFADAADHSFGFNFYPSNLQVERRSIPLSLLLTGKANSYQINAFLEGVTGIARRSLWCHGISQASPAKSTAAGGISIPGMNNQMKKAITRLPARRLVSL